MAHFDYDKDSDVLDRDAKGPSFTLRGQEFQCWSDVPARAIQAVEVVELGGQRVPVSDIIGAIQALLITRRWIVDDTGTGPDGEITQPSGHWEDADDAERFRALINDPDEFVKAETLGNIYQDITAELGRRPTSRSRR